MSSEIKKSFSCSNKNMACDTEFYLYFISIDLSLVINSGINLYKNFTKFTAVKVTNLLIPETDLMAHCYIYNFYF
jgi:hypothetical protein